MSRRNTPTLSSKLHGRWLVALLAGFLLSGTAEARPSWNPPSAGKGLSLSQQAGRSYARHRGAYNSSMSAARRQYGAAFRSGDKSLRARADGNLQRAMASKAKMLRARARGLDAKKEAAFRKAQAMENKGDKAGAEAWLNKAVSYETKARSMNKHAARLSNPKFQKRLIQRYGKMYPKMATWKRRPGTSTTSTGIPTVSTRSKTVKPWKAAGRSYGKQYNTYRKAQLNHLQAAKSAFQKYRQTGDAQALQQARQAGVQRLRAKASMYGVQARALEAKAKAAAKAGKVELANKYSKNAHKASKLAAALSRAVDRFAAKLSNGQLKNPRARQARASDEIEDGPTGMDDAGEMDFADDGPQMGGQGGVQQAMDGESAPGVDGPKVHGIRSYKGKKMVKAQLSAGNILGAMDTLKRMEAQGNRRGLMGMVDRYRKWSSKRRIMKDAYRTGKSAAKIGDVELTQQALHAITELGRPGWRTNHKVRKIANKAITGAKYASKHRNPEMARELLDLAHNIQMAQGRSRPTWRFRRVRRSARSRLWKDIKRRAKDGNIEAFRSAMRLAHAYAQEDGKPLTKREIGKIRKLYVTAMKRSVVRSLDDAQKLLKYGASPEEAQARLVYAMETADRLAKRGITVKTGLFRRSVKGKFEKVRKQLIKAIQSGNQLEHKKPGLFARWFKMNRGPAMDIAPRPRTATEVAAADRQAREQQQMAAIQQALMSGEISPEQLPPQLLQQMGFQPPPANMQ